MLKLIESYVILLAIIAYVPASFSSPYINDLKDTSSNDRRNVAIDDSDATDKLKIPTVDVVSSEANDTASMAARLNTTTTEYTVCQTESCRQVAAELAENLNETANPCEDFYNYACGGWVAKHPVPPKKSTTSTLQIIGETVDERIRDILSEGAKVEDTRALRLARSLYKMCMDTETLDKVGIAPMVNIINQIGGWPMALPLLEWNKNNDTTWQNVSRKIDKTFMADGLFNIVVNPDDKNATRHIINIYEPTTMFTRSVLADLNNETSKLLIYQKYVKNVVRAFSEVQGFQVDEKQLKKDIYELFLFATRLLNITSSQVDKFDIDKTYNLMTIEELQKFYDEANPQQGQVNWLETFQNLFSSTDIDIDKTELVVLQCKPYLRKIVPILESTSSRTIVNYLQWQLIHRLISFTDTKMEKIVFEMRKELGIVQELEDRWKVCTHRISLNSAISYEYVKRYFPAEYKTSVQVFVDDIKKVLEDQIQRASWMDDQTKSVSLEKLRSMKARIGSPEWYSDSAIDLRYHGMLVTTNYFESMLKLYEHEGNWVLNHLRKPVPKENWAMEPTEINAFYMPPVNSIFMTASILQNPVFNLNRPDVMNFGALGFIVAHEMSHGFDNYGRQYDKNGNSIQWWTNQTIEEYNRTTQCFIDQYNGYIVEELKALGKTVHVNGQLTLGENIGDSAGASAAFMAYKRYAKTQPGPEVRLPSLEHVSSDKLFFISIANVFCENLVPSMVEILNEDVHPRTSTRMRGSFSNMKEFSDAFNCPIGSGMNPEKKCTLW